MPTSLIIAKVVAGDGASIPIRSVSGSFTQLTGYGSTEVVGQDLGVLFGPDTDPDSIGRLRAAIWAGAGSQHWLACYRKDGTAFTAALELLGVLAGDGGSDVAIKLQTATAEHGRTAVSIEELSRAFRNSVLDLSSAGFWLLDARGRTLEVNPALCRMLGRERDDVIGLSPLDFAAPTARPWLQKQLEHIPKRRQRSYDTVMRAKNGTEIYAHLDATTLFDKAGTLIGSFAVVSDLTGQRWAEDELRKSEERFRNLAECSLQGIVVHRHLKPLFTNAAFASMHGYTVREIMALPSIAAMVAPEDLPSLQEFRQRQVSGEDPSDRFEHRALRKDGSRIWVETRVHKVEWDGADAYQITTYEISKRRHAEQARKAVHDAVLSVAEAADFRGALKGALRALALNLNLPFASIWLPDPDNTFLTARAVWHSGSPELQRFEDESRRVQIRPGQGVAGIVWQTQSPYFADDFSTMSVGASPLAAAAIAAGIRFVVAAPVILAGKVLAVIAICADRNETEHEVLTDLVSTVAAQLGAAFERRQAEAAQRESEARFRLIATSSPVPTAILRVSDPAFIFANAACEQALGLAPGQARGLNWHQFIPAPDAIDRLRLDIGDDGEINDFELTLRTFAGETILAMVTARWMGFENDSAVFATFRDVTELKRREEEQRRLDEQLNQSRKMEALGTLAGGVAHDINNALVPILGLASVAGMQLPGDSKAHEYLDRIAAAAERIRDLTQRILAFSRAEGDDEGETAPIDLAAAIEDAAGFVRPTLPSSIALSPDIDADTGSVRASVTQMHQIMINLLTNAAQAMDGRPGLVEIEVKPVELDGNAAALLTLPPGAYGHVRVADNGPGMPPEVRERIFDPFFTTKGVGEGTGLGLSVIHGIIVSLGGTVTVSSEPGSGAQFDIYLPLSLTDADTAGESGETDWAMPATVSQGHA